MGTGSFPGVKRSGRGVDHPPPSSPEFTERVELYLYSRLWAFVVCSRVSFTFTTKYRNINFFFFFQSAVVGILLTLATCTAVPNKSCCTEREVCVLWTRTILAGMTPVRCIYSSDSRVEEKKKKCEVVEMRQQNIFMWHQVIFLSRTQLNSYCSDQCRSRFTTEVATKLH